MTTNVVPDDQVALLARRQHELTRRVYEGTLDPFWVAGELQRVIEGPSHDAELKLLTSAGRHLKVRLTPRQRRALATVPYSDEVLRECANTHVLVPYLGLSLQEVHAARSELFYSKDWENAWYGKPEQTFSRTTHQPRWYLVQKTVLEGSCVRTWASQLALVGDSGTHEVIPAAVLAYTCVFHYLQTGEKLFPGIYGRTSDVTADGYHAILGSIDGTGLDVGDRWDSRSNSDLGVAVSQKL